MSGPIDEPKWSAKDKTRADVLQLMLSLTGNPVVDQWLTLAEISQALGYPEASISARLRDFRKKKFGSYHVSRRRRVAEAAIWEYRVLEVIHAG